MFVDHLMFLSRDLLHEGLFFFVFLMTSFFFFLRVISSFGVVFCLRLSAKYLRVSFFQFHTLLGCSSSYPFGLLDPHFSYPLSLIKRTIT